MVGVTWERLTLEGFGRFDHPVTIELQPGPNVLVAPNEEGKSTLLAGLTAVLFGLEGGNNPEGFTEGRYRNWDRGETFRGQLVFSVEGATYLIQRDFAARTATLLAGDASGWRRVAGGRHHASARRVAEGFERALYDLIGVGSRELFESTFYLRQPLPEVDKLDAAVQGLLSGAGGGFDDALGILEDQLREVTRYSARLGVTTRDAHADRELEQVRRDIAGLENDIRSQRTTVDSLEQSQRMLEAARSELQTARQALSTAQQLEGAWQKWLGYRDDRKSLVEARGALERALQQAAQAGEELARAQERCNGFPEMRELPADAGELLARLRQLRNQQAASEERLASLMAACAALQEQHDALVATIREQYADVADRPGLLSDYDRLGVVLRRREELEKRRDGLLEAQREAAAALEAGGTDWSPLGSAPEHTVRRLEVEAARLADRWQSLTRDQCDLARVEEGIGRSYAGFDSLSPDQLALAGQAATERRRLREGVASVAQCLERLSAAQETGRRRGLAALGYGVLGGGILGATIWAAFAQAAGTGALAVLVLAAALAIGGLAYVLAARKAARNLPVAEIVAVLAEAAGREAGDDKPDALAGLLAAKADALRSAQEELEVQLGPVLAALPDPGDAVADWQAAVAAAAVLRGRIGVTLGELGLADTAVASGVDAGVGGLGALRASPLPGDASAWWGELATLAQVAGGLSPVSCGDLLDWLGELDGKWWTSAQRDARRWMESTARWETARTELTQLGHGSPAGDGLGALAAIEAEAVQLREAIKPFDETVPRGRLIELQAQLAQAREQLARHAAELQRDTEEVARLRAGLAALSDEQQSLAAALAPLLRAAGNDSARAAVRLDEAARASAALDGARRHLDGILRGQGARDVAELQERRIELDAEIASLLGRWDLLLEQYPVLLPRPAASDSDPTPLQAQMERLTEQRQIAQGRVDGAAEQVASLTAEIARLQGAGRPLNLAQAEGQLAEMRRRETELAFEAEAIALAHLELKTAVHEYQNAYRGQLAAAASTYFDGLSGGRGRRVVLDEGFGVSVLMPAGLAIRPAQLSQGARDQLYVALRLAIADMVSGRVGLPVLFDDPFLTFDPDRLGKMQETFSQVAAGRQLWLLSHRSEYLTWGAAVTVRQIDQWPDTEAM